MTEETSEGSEGTASFSEVYGDHRPRRQEYKMIHPDITKLYADTTDATQKVYNHVTLEELLDEAIETYGKSKMKDSVPDWCEACQNEEPEFVIKYRDPKEYVYYCGDCYGNHVHDDKAVEKNPLKS